MKRAALAIAPFVVIPIIGAPPPICFADPTGARPYWQHQSYVDDCAEMAVADVVGLRTGQALTEQQIIDMAENTPSTAHPGPIYEPHHGKGTNDRDLDTLLARYGVHSVTSASADADPSTDIESLQQALAGGQQAIVAVNANTLWDRPTGDHAKENHFVVVTGIDSAADVVHLDDSGITNGQDEQAPLAVFTAAWAASRDDKTVTDPG